MGHSDQGRRRRPRTPIKEIHRADKHDKHTVTDTLQQQLRTNKHTVTDALQQQLRTMMSAIQGRKAFVQCAILVAMAVAILLAHTMATTRGATIITADGPTTRASAMARSGVEDGRSVSIDRDDKKLKVYLEYTKMRA